jgi:hypothetical protein
MLKPLISYPCYKSAEYHVMWQMDGDLVCSWRRDIVVQLST